MVAAVACCLAPLPLILPMVATGQWPMDRVLFAVVFAVLGPLIGRVIARATLANWRNRGLTPLHPQQTTESEIS
jgi:H+/Cl- antiporter ClcA